MSNPSVVDLKLAAAVSNGVALAQTPGGAGNLTLNGSLVSGGVATFDVARRVAVASTGNDAGVVFIITGTDRYGNAQVDTVTGLNASTGYTARDFSTVIAIQASAATVGGITAGTNGVGSSDWVLDNFLAPFWALSIACHIVSGAATYTVEHTYDDPNAPGPSYAGSRQQFSMEPASAVPPLAWPNATLAAKAVDAQAQYVDQPIMAHRLTITAGTGQVVMQSIQAGIGSP